MENSTGLEVVAGGIGIIQSVGEGLSGGMFRLTCEGKVGVGQRK